MGGQQGAPGAAAPAQRRLAGYDGEILDGVETALKPIVDRDTLESVRKYLADPKRFTGRSMGRKHLLSVSPIVASVAGEWAR